MRSEHITELLDSQKASNLSADERTLIAAHVTGCAECRDAFRQAIAADALLQARMTQAVEPSPFFATRVMAAVREKLQEPDPFSILSLWRTARGLVTGMAAVVLVLGGLTFADLSGSQNSVSTGEVASSDPAEQVLFQNDYQNVSYDPTNAQVTKAVFGPEDSNADY
jgi:anti-sigma factor RsiW